MTSQEPRERLMQAIRKLSRRGILDASSGNISLRTDDQRIFVTPSGIDYDDMEPSDLVEIALSDAVVEGNYPPSSEWPLHREIYKVRVDAEMVIHSHAPFATTMACLERSIPPFHYMVALSGGVNIPCLPYRPIGGEELAQEIATTLSSRHACLMGHHGMVVVGESIEKAIWRAKELENVCEQYWRAIQIREPALLPQKRWNGLLKYSPVMADRRNYPRKPFASSLESTASNVGVSGFAFLRSAKTQTSTARTPASSSPRKAPITTS